VGVESFANLYGCQPQELVELVREEITRLLCLSVIRSELAGDTQLDEDLSQCETLMALMDTMLTGNGDGALRFHATYLRPIVAIGAPAGVLMPPAGERLQAEVVVPTHAEVANAVGAIVGRVSATEQMAVRPSGFESFTVYAPSGRREFKTMDDAVAWASEEAGRLARERAVASGATDPEVAIDVDRRVGRLATGEQQLIEVRVRATAAGYPQGTAAARDVS